MLKLEQVKLEPGQPEELLAGNEIYQEVYNSQQSGAAKEGL